MKMEYCLGLIHELAKTTKTEVGPLMIRVYMKELEKIGWEKAANGLEKCFMDLRRFPTLKDILDAAGAVLELSREDEANALVDRMLEAASKFGFYRKEDAKKYLGEKAWAVASKHWEEITMSDVNNRTTLRSQLRKSMLAEDGYQKFNQTQIGSGDFDAVKFIDEAKTL